ncbi:MAG: DUF3782 domain-containing protein [Magnetococcales bacterium]|nr:DUF3782 domain-containing protein [Magnetococcales bacterium]
MFQESQQKWEQYSQESRVKTDREMHALREMFAETSRQMRESSEETDRKIKKVSTLVGNLGSRWGDFVEGIVAAAGTTLFAKWGIPVHKVTRNIKAYLPGNREMEIDVLVVNTTVAVLVEVKSRLQLKHIQKHIKRLNEFKEFFPEYADKQTIGAVAGIVIDEQVGRYAMDEGLFVIVQSGENVELANGPDFVPKNW